MSQAVSEGYAAEGVPQEDGSIELVALFTESGMSLRCIYQGLLIRTW